MSVEWFTVISRVIEADMPNNANLFIGSLDLNIYSWYIWIILIIYS